MGCNGCVRVTVVWCVGTVREGTGAEQSGAAWLSCLTGGAKDRGEEVCGVWCVACGVRCAVCGGRCKV